MKEKKNSQLVEIWKRLRRNKLAVAGMAMLLLIVFTAIFADVLAPLPL